MATSPMGNPWLNIPLDDYEGHMSLPEVGQAQMIGDQLERTIMRWSQGTEFQGLTRHFGTARRERTFMARLRRAAIKFAFILSPM
jgi:hypothetical protein